MRGPVTAALGALREPLSGLTHLGGAFLSLAGLVLLTTAAARGGGAWDVASFAVFGTSLFLLYAASTLYHLLPLSDEGVRALRRLDHMAIFVLIAGTYTPFCLGPLRGGVGPALLAAVWGIAALGIAFKIFWLHAPRALSTAIYVGMGWLSLAAIRPLIDALPAAGTAWLAGGGLLYTVGGVVYALKRPDPWPRIFGFHEIWHLFVLAGSFCHFWAVYRHVLGT